MVIITVVEGSETENYLKVVPANEVLATIQENYPIEYDNCIIEGKLNLSELFVNRPAHFNNIPIPDPHLKSPIIMVSEPPT
jgi:hypothetical protein